MALFFCNIKPGFLPMSLFIEYKVKTVSFIIQMGLLPVKIQCQQRDIRANVMEKCLYQLNSHTISKVMICLRLKEVRFFYIIVICSGVLSKRKRTTLTTYLCYLINSSDRCSCQQTQRGGANVNMAPPSVSNCQFLAQCETSLRGFFRETTVKF